ncbi:Lrp/AsnC family transcriptional regulator [Qipengyuania flava]|uniref:Lrp/AsnC family transcriptional regulator n=1 Tax=Qipengyuania flava TaxID=192812 RepID=UPI001C62736B|nr:Lrp/AsnC family transcriptional regulator [Qipengyuania flava]QYJ07030.1 Lrp/AsnC family transcriptional regulator [Qipengyuania flava]
MAICAAMELQTMDEFDRRILAIVQADASRSHQSIGEEVNLSPSSVRRRLQALRKDGVILGEVALVDPAKLGLSFLTLVSFEKESQRIYDAFRRQMIADEAVSQCYSVSGEFDFVLMVHAVSPAAYEQWGERVLMANPALKRYSTSVVWSHTKFTTRVTPAQG